MVSMMGRNGEFVALRTYRHHMQLFGGEADAGSQDVIVNSSGSDEETFARETSSASGNSHENITQFRNTGELLAL